MSVVSNRKPRPSEYVSRRPEPRLTAVRREPLGFDKLGRNKPLSFDELWGNAVAFTSLAVLVGIIAVLAAMR